MIEPTKSELIWKFGVGSKNGWAIHFANRPKKQHDQLWTGIHKVAEDEVDLSRMEKKSTTRSKNYRKVLERDQTHCQK
jgi:hypothetical protein